MARRKGCVTSVHHSQGPASLSRLALVLKNAGGIASTHPAGAPLAFREKTPRTSLVLQGTPAFVKPQAHRLIRNSFATLRLPCAVGAGTAPMTDAIRPRVSLTERAGENFSAR